uniref:Cation-transporting P-type ATPase C-terminal domain-containing protein n=1 Tax=Florenciella parvula TaxID=236787 RepID=A0A7S2BYF1_9STRA
MARDPRNTYLEQLLTGKMFFFSFFQLGMVQACAGFYAYLVAMNDYGYPPHLMLRSGDSDYWGNYPLYCQFVGGQYVNTAGEVDHTRYPGNHPPTFEYPLWDEGDAGYVKECVFPIKNVLGRDSNPNSRYMKYVNSEFMTDLRKEGYDTEFKVATAISYDHNTGEGGADMVSIEAIEALQAAGYYEYTPWKARVSGFWNSKWLAYDIVGGVSESFADSQIPTSKINLDDAEYEEKKKLKAKKKLEALSGGPSLATHEVRLYFNKMSLGLWSICLQDWTMGKTQGAVWYAQTEQLESVYGWNATKSSSSNCSVPGSMVVGSQESAPLMRKLKKGQEIGEGTGVAFTEALFCNGDRSYDRMLAKHGITWDYHHGRWRVDFSDVNGPYALQYPLTDREKDDLKTKAQNCWKLDDHPNQVQYCKDTCSTTCEKVPGVDRANTTIWEGGDGYDVKQCFSISSRMSQREALYQARTAFAVAIVICQLFAAATVKTRWQSVTTLGMDNTYINFGIVIGCITLAYAVYTPILNNVIQTRPIRFTHWLPGIPWAFVIIAFDEVRKFTMRITSRVNLKTGKIEKGWVEKNSMY